MLRDLTRRLVRDQIPTAFENLFIVNFNYDRCLELFVFLWLKQMYGFDDNQSAKICANLQVYHPYGKIGDLPHENPAKHIAFGGKVSGDRLVSIASNIHTYSESALDEMKLNAARAALGEAKRLVFMGFGFHEQNMDVLTVPKNFERPTLRCYATTKDVSGPRLELDKGSIAAAFQVRAEGGVFFEHVPDTCEKFWEQYGDVVTR